MIENILDTIAAISTSKGSSAIGIIRISGSKSLSISKLISKKKKNITVCC